MISLRNHNQATHQVPQVQHSENQPLPQSHGYQLPVIFDAQYQSQPCPQVQPVHEIVPHHIQPFHPLHTQLPHLPQVPHLVTQNHPQPHQPHHVWNIEGDVEDHIQPLPQQFSLPAYQFAAQ